MSPITSSFGYRSDALDVAAGHDLTGKVALVTGASSGIGLETARALASTGATVVMPVRDRGRGEAAVADILASHPNATLELDELELGSIASARACAASVTARHDKIHIVVNNAAVMATPQGRTTDGHELQFGTNHLGHMALFEGLLPALRAAEGARVVALTSIGHRLSDVDLDDVEFERRPYDKWVSYGQSKTACSLFAVGVTNRFGDEGILANSVHPGGIMTNLQRHMPIEEQVAMGWIDEAGNVNDRFKTPQQGAATSTWAALGDELSGIGGLYLEDCKEAEDWTAENPFAGRKYYAIDPERAEALWELSLQLLVR